ncbi:MAG: peptidase M20 [Candidatus Marinimicrobia bacterium]|nr:peptidase M20 [Candidatus Neomarinimicrobiota bacterium]|tara:strand:- start:7757 stop:8923 length:1167 start_codon:yes stop_codon:yes gene_type:complete
MNISLRPEIEAIRDEIIDNRRHFHMHPELGLQEYETARFISEKLSGLGMEVSTKVGQTGVVALLRGADGPCVGLRADMDALPIQETGKADYKSVNDGVMHACGHDGHMAMLLGAAEALSKKRDNLSGTVKFIFQPAEEGLGGARYMIDDGVLSNPKVDEIYGIHLWNYQSFGTVGIQPGPVLAAADEFVIKVKGKGGHGAMPHGTVDAIVVSAHLITALQTIVSRNTNPLESTALTVGVIEGGYNFNIISDEVILKGTARSYTEENRAMISRRLQEICDGISASFGAEIEVNYHDGYPPTVNSIVESENVTSAAVKIVAEGVQPPYLTMGAEDMSYYLMEVPGCFFFLGSAPEGERVPHHCSHFDINEEALLVGSSILVELVEERLKG